MNNYEYNRKRLMLPEYGRHVHHMVDYLMTIEDRKERSFQAEVVVAIMRNINTSLKNSDDALHTIWDHLFIISDFRLDVDAPFPMPSKEILNSIPRRMEYPTKEFSMKHYGKNIRKMIKAVAKLDKENEDREIVATNIAKFMQLKSHEYNQEHPNNSVILNDLKILSENSIILDEDTLNNIKVEHKQNFAKKNNKKGGVNNKNQSQKNQKHRYKNNRNK